MIRALLRVAIAALTPTLPLLSPTLSVDRAMSAAIVRPADAIAIDIRPAVLVRLERSIARHENCVQWNNPGCLAYAGQANALRLANGYAEFLTERDGRVALENDLRAKLGRCMNVGEIAQAWNRAKYLPALLRETGLRQEDGWCSQK